MKTLISILFCLAFIPQAIPQDKIIDTDKPISNIDISYSVNNKLMFTLLLNSRDNTQTLSSAPTVDFKATIEGQIKWAIDPGNPKENLVSGTFTSSSSDSPFKYSTELKNGLGFLIPMPTEKNWTSIINVKIKYEIDGKYNELPSMTIYPPGVITPVISKAIKISTQAKMIDKRKAEIALESEPSGLAFEVTQIELIKTSGGNQSKGGYNASEIGDARFANNGKINLLFNTTFDIDDNTASYQVSVKAKAIGTSEIINSPLTDVVFIDASPLRILNRPADYSLTVNDSDELIDSDINTTGIGDLGIRFATTEYENKIQKQRTNLGSVYTFQLKGLNALPDKSHSYFYYTSNGKIISPPHLIVKEAPVLTNFHFDGINADRISLGFNLPAFVDPTLISLNIVSKDNKDLVIGGSYVVKRDLTDPTKININLPNDLTTVIANDTIRDLGFIVNYKAVRLYSLNLKLFNQKLLNEKIAELVANASDRPARRNREQIKAIVEDIVKIGESVGNSMSDAEVNQTVDELKNGNKEQIKNTMLDIGKWALLVGKIVLPVL